MMPELRYQLEQLVFWDKLTDEEKERVADYAVIRDYKKDSILHAMEGDCLGLIVVLGGSVRAYMMSEEGREITLYHIREGEYDVLTASCIMYQVTFDTQMVLEEDSRILIVPTTVLAGLKQNNVYVRSFIYEVLTQRFSDVMWTFQQIVFYGIDQRVAAYLLNHAEERQAGEQADIVHATHEQIAREINTAREVVARIIKRFAEDSLLETGRGTVTIKDQKGLRRITEDFLLNEQRTTEQK
ncbi:MAG: Crp/Fnr family transcriptional regulator [Clostridia bacterium]|nr:Crp/Fnr family transcriptional regulator [Clostridia bacterium]